MSRSLKALLLPDPPRRVPAHRALGIVFRTAHLMTFGALLGGHLFDVEAGRLVPFLVATAASGVALMALECWATFAWLFMVKGLAVLLKIGLLLLVPVFWDHRVLLLLGVVAVASAAAHMPARFRHYSLLSGGAAPRDAPIGPSGEPPSPDQPSTISRTSAG